MRLKLAARVVRNDYSFFSAPLLERSPLGWSEMPLESGKREQAKIRAQRIIDVVTDDLARGVVDDLGWSRRVADALTAAYLLEDDPRWQSGFDGDASLWREARELILAPIHTNGTFLDIGCATGYLMECLQVWARERQRSLIMYGLELSPGLVAVARNRAPDLANRIFEGNVLDWAPPHRFTFVHTGLEYVPARRQAWLVRRLLDAFLEPGGRLIAGPVAQAELSASRDAFRGAGASAEIAEHTDHAGKTRYVLWCSSAIA